LTSTAVEIVRLTLSAKSTSISHRILPWSSAGRILAFDSSGNVLPRLTEVTSIGSWRQLGGIIVAHEPGQRAAGWVKPALKLLPRALLAAAAQQVVPVSLEDLGTDDVDPVG
jgi:hypothetical protein